MEYCAGESLEKYLLKRNQGKGIGFTTSPDPGVIDRKKNLEIFSHVVNGMVQIHKNKVLHRDLKPENIFIDINAISKETIAKIGDFGLARMLDKNQPSNTSQRFELFTSSQGTNS